MDSSRPNLADNVENGDMVIKSMETYEKNLFLANVYGKLEEARRDMANGRYFSVEDAVSRIRKTHGL